MSGVFEEELFFEGDVLDLKNMEGTNCYCSEESAVKLREVISGCPTRAIHWIDTGDYHYLSLFFLEKIDRDFELLLFDHHPDNQPLAFEAPGMLSCGSWVKKALEAQPFLKNICACGVDCYKASDKSLPVYLSIDLDVLSKDEFKTDWDQGELLFDEMVLKIKELCSGREILGIDICGGLTKSKKAADEDLRLNCEVRKRLMLELAGTV